METLPMFSFEDLERETPDTTVAEIDGGAADVPGQDQVDRHPDLGEEQPLDSAGISVEPEQGSSEADAERAVIGEQAQVGARRSIYHSTGLDGPFELDQLVMVFPDSPDEDLYALAADIGANGLLEEITVGGNPPAIVDGKRRLQACGMAGVQPKYRLLCEDIDLRNYIWAKNGERRHLTPSQKALAFAELFPSSAPGRPPNRWGNCAIVHNFHRPTQGEGARALGISRRLIIDAEKIVAPNGRVAPEVREAIKLGIVAVSDAVKDTVRDASTEVQREALGLVEAKKVRTMAAAVKRVVEEGLSHEGEPLLRFDRPTRLGKTAAFYQCSVDGLKRRLKPGAVDLILANPPDWVQIRTFSEIGALAKHALCDAGVLVVVAVATGALCQMLNRVTCDGLEFITEFSLLFPAPIYELGEPHQTEIRRAALLVFGKQGTKLPKGNDVIEVLAPADGIAADDFMEINDGLPLVFPRFSSPGQVVCVPWLKDNTTAALAALESGCTVIGADDDQSVINDFVREASEHQDQSSA